MGYEGDKVKVASPDGEPKKYEWFPEPEVVYSDFDTVRLFYRDVGKYMTVTFHFPTNEDHTKFLESERTPLDFIKHHGAIYYHEPYTLELERDEARRGVANATENESPESRTRTNDAELEEMLGLPTKRIRQGSRIARKIFFKDKFSQGSIMDSLQDARDEIEQVLGRPANVPVIDPVVKKPERVNTAVPTIESPYLPTSSDQEDDDVKRRGYKDWPEF